jgi:hypothetical protein
MGKKPGPGGSSCTKVSTCKRVGLADWECSNGGSCALEYGRCLPCSQPAQTSPNINPLAGNGPPPGTNSGDNPPPSRNPPPGTGSQPDNNPPSGFGASPGSNSPPRSQGVIPAAESSHPSQENMPQAGSPGISSSLGTTALPIPNAPTSASSQEGMASLIETSFSPSSDSPSTTISSSGTSTTAGSSLSRSTPSNTSLGSGKKSAGSHHFGGLFDAKGWSFMALVASLNLVL